MASVVRGRGDSWEIRESVSTPRGPRSRTLATFKRLDRDVIEHARARASRPVDAGDLVRAADRVGAPVEPDPADEAAASLLERLTAGEMPRPALGQLIADHIRADLEPPSDAARAAADWIGASANRRAEALVDLLLLVDALPPRRRGSELRFPRLTPR